MACGLPVIAVDAHGPAEIVDARRDRLAGAARRPRRARRGARGGGQRPRGAPPPRRPRRARSRSSATPGRRSPSGSPRSTRTALRRALTRFRTCCTYSGARTAATFPRSASGPPPAHREHPSCTSRRDRPAGRPLRPQLRARRLWRRHGRAPQRRADATRPCSAPSSRWRTSSTAAPRAPTPTPATAPGSCSSCPTSSCAVVVGDDLPPPGALRRRRLLPAPGRRAARRARAAAERHGRGRGPARRRLARRAGRQGLRRHHRQLLRALHQAARRGRGTASCAARPGRVRAQALRDPPRGRAGRRPGPRDPVVLRAARSSTRACSPRPQLLGYYPDLQDTRTKTALALVHSRFSHEHVPELGARAPVPDDRPQRRDQHAARQRQLDARARVAARLRAVRRRPARSCCRSSAPAARLGDVRQRARAARAGRPHRCRTR